METLQGIISRLPSFRVVDIPPDRSSPFNADKEKLMQLTKNKDQDILQELGGVDGIILSLKAHTSHGIRGDLADLGQRINFFESNYCKIRGVVRRYIWAVLDRLIEEWFPFLSICCVYLIIAGIKLYGWSDGWKDGVYSLAFIIVFPLVSSTIGQIVGEYFDRVIKGSQLVIVLRNGLKQLIPASNILVGDIALLKKGDEIPADGLLLEAYGDQPLKLYYTGEIVEINCSYPFMNSGAKVVEGRAKMMITRAAKRKNFHRRYEKTKLGAQINYLIRLLEIMKCVLALSSFIISFSRYFAGTAKDDNGLILFNRGATSALEASYMIGLYIITATVIFIAMDTTNFSWALEICFAHAINVMAGRNVIVRNLSSWENIGLGVATVNVIDEFNASNQLITSIFLFVPQITENKKPPSCITPNVLELIQQGIGINMTGISNHAQRRCKLKFLGSPRERAFTSQAGLESGKDWEKLMNECAIIRVETLENQGRLTLVKWDDSFLEHRRGSAEMILSLCSDYYDDLGALRSLDNHTRRLLCQRLQRIDFDVRTQVIALAYRRVPDQQLKDDSHLVEEEDSCYLLGFVVLKDLNQDGIRQVMIRKYRDTGMDLNIFHEENLDSGIAGAAVAAPEEMGKNHVLENEISATGTTAREDIMECEGGNGSKETTENFTELENNQKNLGSVEVVPEVAQNNQNEDLGNRADSVELGETESNKILDDEISAEGALSGQHDIIESEEESNESKEETECSKEVICPSRSDDSITLEHIPNATDLVPVKEEVASLSEAIVSISMGIKGDETRNSDIVILDEKITTLPLILMFAKCMLLNIQTFTQFQLTVMITSIASAFISLVQPLETSGVNRTLALEWVQQMWVNTVMGLIGSMAFGRQRAQYSTNLLQKPPEEEKIWLITEYMLRNIVVQSVYQITVISMLQYKGTIFGFTDSETKTATFVVPILLQVLNMINARKIEEKNIFSGIRPRFIWLIAALMIATFVWVEILARTVNLERLEATQWGICIAIALVSWPVGFAAKFVPVGFFLVPVHLVAAAIMSVVNRSKELGNWIKLTASKLSCW